MGSQRVRINSSRTLFYCWSWGGWRSVKKLPYCFGIKRCRRMYEPELPHLRKDQVAAAAR